MERAWPFEAVRQFVLKAGDGRTNAELADIVRDELRISISGDAISRWRTGETRDVPAPHLFAIARRLDLSIDQFVLEEGLEQRVTVLETHVRRIIAQLEDAGLATEVDMIDKPGGSGAKIPRRKRRGTT